MLDRAAAANAEMRTERRHAFGTGAFDRNQLAAVGMVAGDRRHLDGFAAERIRHVDAFAASGRDAVAAVADMVDDEPFGVSHGAPR